MKTKAILRLVALLVPLVLFACEDSENCTCPPATIDPPMSDLEVTWHDGHMFADLMPIVPPDPLTCRAWLILENKNLVDQFSKLEIPMAVVFLAKNDSTLGGFPMETDWNGVLEPGEIDTILFFKNQGTQPIFDPPCGDQVLIEFQIQNADEATMSFVSDTVKVNCVY